MSTLKLSSNLPTIIVIIPIIGRIHSCYALFIPAITRDKSVLAIRDFANTFKTGFALELMIFYMSLLFL